MEKIKDRGVEMKIKSLVFNEQGEIIGEEEIEVELDHYHYRELRTARQGDEEREA
jgi:hypothetical protein